MQIEIKCMECQKRTRHFEIGPAAYSTECGNEILLKEKLFCPKCKKEISNGKCIVGGGEFIISLMAITMGTMAERENKLIKLPPHLRGMVIVSKENYKTLKAKSKGVITLATKL